VLTLEGWKLDLGEDWEWASTCCYLERSSVIYLLTSDVAFVPNMHLLFGITMHSIPSLSPRSTRYSIQLTRVKTARPVPRSLLKGERCVTRVMYCDHQV
jgi:hypothetical protein